MPEFHVVIVTKNGANLEAPRIQAADLQAAVDVAYQTYVVPNTKTAFTIHVHAGRTILVPFASVDRIRIEPQGLGESFGSIPPPPKPQGAPW